MHKLAQSLISPRALRPATQQLQTSCSPILSKAPPIRRSAPASPFLCPHRSLIRRFADSDRYSRQILFPGIGPEGQQRLARAHAAVIGVGATGAATASLLARAGVGRLTSSTATSSNPPTSSAKSSSTKPMPPQPHPKPRPPARKSRTSTPPSGSKPTSPTSSPPTSPPCWPMRLCFWIAPTTLKPATCSTTTPSTKANHGSTPAPSPPRPPP